MLLGQVFRVGSGGAVNRVQLYRLRCAQQGDLAFLQPADQFFFATLAQIGAGGEGDGTKNNSQAQEGKTVVRYLKKSIGNV